MKNHPEILTHFVKSLITIRNRQMLWSTEVVELNKRISEIISQSHTLTVLNQQGVVDPDIFIAKSNQLAEQLRKAKQQKEKLQDMEDDKTIEETQQMMEVLIAGARMLESFDGELLDARLIGQTISAVLVDSNGRVRIKLKNRQVIERGE